MRALLRDLADLLLPPACAGCGQAPDAARPLCAACDARLPRLAPGALPELIPGVDACHAAVAFAGEAETWLRRFKYPAPGWAGLDPGPGAVVRALAREAARGVRPGPVVAIPLHPRRQRARGFNPAALVARAVADELGARFSPAALSRLRDTPSQTGLDRRGRARNVAGAFRATGPADRRVLLVDDVVTTGATLAAAARALRRAGAREVVAICVARTL